MRGFIDWLLKQPKYVDLARDAGDCGSLRGLMRDMLDYNAPHEAWRMLFDAIHACPLPLPAHWHRDAFRPCVSVRALLFVVGDYVRGLAPSTEAMPDKEFETLATNIRLLWWVDPHGAETVINDQRCSSIQYCLLWGLR